MKKLVYFHGEVAVISGANKPKSAKKVEQKDGRYILANSEISGNHHILVAQDGVDVYEGVDGTLFVHVEDEAQVKCVLEDRHDTQVLPAGDYIVRRKVEYDHLTNTPRVVAD
jgi:hypothetical protein